MECDDKVKDVANWIAEVGRVPSNSIALYINGHKASRHTVLSEVEGADSQGVLMFDVVMEQGRLGEVVQDER